MNKILGLIIIISMVLSSTSLALDAKPSGEFDNTNVNTGIIGVRYAPKSELRLKTRVQKGDGKYDYDLLQRLLFEYFPLQLGSGTYKVTIFENITGNKYRTVKSQDIKADIKDPLSVYTASIQTINWNEDMKVIKKAAVLTKGLKTDEEKIKAIHKYVIDTLSYDSEKIKQIDNTYVPDIEKVVSDGKGICYDYAAVFAAMLRSQNIPTKLIKGYSDYVKVYHAWNEVYLKDKKKWIVVDTTYDSVMKRNGKAFTIEKDRGKYKPSREY